MIVAQTLVCEPLFVPSSGVNSPVPRLAVTATISLPDRVSFMQGAQSMNTDRLAEGLGWFSIGLGAMEIFAPRQLERLVGLKDNDRRRTILRTYGFREVA